MLTLNAVIPLLLLYFFSIIPVMFIGIVLELTLQRSLPVVLIGIFWPIALPACGILVLIALLFYHEAREFYSELFADRECFLSLNGNTHLLL